MPRLLAATILLAVLTGAIVSGDALRARMSWGADTTPPPLGTSVLWRRGMDADDYALTGTASILALHMESLDPNGSRNPWPLYVETRNASSTNGVGVYSRFRNEGTAWGAAFHAEPIARGTGTTVGVNVEPSPMVDAGRVVGVNVQAQDGYGHDGNGPHVPVAEGINLQSAPLASFGAGIRFDGATCTTGLHFDTATITNRAIWIQGTHGTGIESNAPIRVASGIPLELSTNGAVEIVFQNGRIEFRNGTRVLAYLVIDSSASGGRIN